MCRTEEFSCRTENRGDFGVMNDLFVKKDRAKTQIQISKLASDALLRVLPLDGVAARLLRALPTGSILQEVVRAARQQ